MEVDAAPAKREEKDALPLPPRDVPRDKKVKWLLRQAKDLLFRGAIAVPGTWPAWPHRLSTLGPGRVDHVYPGRGYPRQCGFGLDRRA